MAKKTLHKFTAPSADNMPVGLPKSAWEMSWDHMDAAAGKTFFSNMVRGATNLIEKMISNIGWSKERLLTHQRGMHTIMETEMLAAKLDLLKKRLDNSEKYAKQGTVKALGSHMTWNITYEPKPTEHEEGQSKTLTDSLIDFMVNFLEREETRIRRYLKLAFKKPGIQAGQPAFPVSKRSPTAPKTKKGNTTNGDRSTPGGVFLFTTSADTGSMQHTLEGHVVQTREWQQSVDAQLANLNTTMQQQ
uniref:Uncharacterized protein n=1 Tax=Oryza sativa subsp. japonica TaxID=39947 RepID=Q6Z645_ORYSJ|nr:hypothetical protein [Oryza sativa Japonica Group]